MVNDLDVVHNCRHLHIPGASMKCRRHAVRLTTLLRSTVFDRRKKKNKKNKKKTKKKNKKNKKKTKKKNKKKNKNKKNKSKKKKGHTQRTNGRDLK